MSGLSLVKNTYEYEKADGRVTTKGVSTISLPIEFKNNRIERIVLRMRIYYQFSQQLIGHWFSINTISINKDTLDVVFF